jgi:hypothetical protein
MMAIGHQRVDTPRHTGMYCHPEAHTGSGGGTESHPAQPPELDRATTAEETTSTGTQSGSSPAPDGNAVSTTVN